jgi:peptidoglycan/LPS O-acetylase OafA/YrhL
MSLQELHDTMFYCLPMFYWGAIGFYVGIVVLLASHYCRTIFWKYFDPIPARTQTMITQLDSMRGLAALWVACCHSWDWLKPFFNANAEAFPPMTIALKAVCIFAIISGLLVYRSIRNYTQSEQLTKYFKRRFFRIYPTYFTIISCLLLMGFVPWTLGVVLAYYCMLQTFFLPMNPYPPFWSLFVEEVFYIGLPVFIAVTRGRTLMVACVGFLVVIAVGQTALQSPWGFSTLLLAFFFTGIILCELLDFPWIQTPNKEVGIFMLGCGLLLMMGDFQGYDFVGRYLQFLFGLCGVTLTLTPPATPSLAAGFALIFLGTIKWPLAGRVLSVPPLRFLGTISFSIFAWHTIFLCIGSGLKVQSGGVAGQHMLGPVPAPLWVLPFVIVPAYLFFGAITYRVIEYPFIHYARTRL